MTRDAKGRFAEELGQHIDSKGYWCFSSGKHRGKRVHRVIMESKLRRKIRKDEHVHHVNGVKTDNRPSNLELMDAHKHNAVSARQYWYLKTNVCPREKAEWDAYFAR